MNLSFLASVSGNLSVTLEEGVFGLRFFLRNLYEKRLTEIFFTLLLERIFLGKGKL